MPSISAARLLSIGTLVSAGLISTVVIVNIVRSLPHQFQDFSLAFWIVSIDIILLCLLLALGTVTRSSWMNHNFGFMQYSAGAGMLLMFIGSLTLGSQWYQNVVGGIAIFWGIVSIIVHFCYSDGVHRTEPLLPS